MIAAVIHRALHLSHKGRADKFVAALANPQDAQAKRLDHILKLCAERGLTAGQARVWFSALPMTTYASYANRLAGDRQAGLTAEPVQRYEPTSGSTSALKFIPYTKSLLSSFNAAASPWLYDLGLRYPGTLRGRHYWSISWFDPTLFPEDVSNELEVFPLYKRLLFDKVLAVSHSLRQAKTRQQFRLRTMLSLLCAPDLTLISIWSPTFLSSLLTEIIDRRDELLDCFSSYDTRLNEPSESLSSTFSKSARLRAINLLSDQSLALDTGFVSALWPNLRLISCWDSSTSVYGCNRLRQVFPDTVAFQGKGLWATEGVVTIPFRDQYALAVNSHYYEFYCESLKRLVQLNELETGQVVRPIMSTASGFLRYDLGDRIRVTGWMQKTPCFEFLGREKTIDLAGEKLSTKAVEMIFDDIRRRFGLEPISLYGMSKGNLGYILLAERGSGDTDCTKITAARELLETSLAEHYHYQLARDLQQINAADVLCCDDGHAVYHAVLRDAQLGGPAVAGSIKIEALQLFYGEKHEFIERVRQITC